MKTITLLLFAILLINPFGLSGQSETAGNGKKFQITDSYFQSSITLESGLDASLTEFRTLAPQSNLLQLDYSNYDKYPSYLYTPSFTFISSIGIQINPDKTRRITPYIRLGIRYNSSQLLSGSYNYMSRFPFDTLYSSQTGDTIIIDSVISNSINATYDSKQLGIDVAILFRTTPSARWSLYSGIGLAASVSISASTKIGFISNRYTEDHSGNHNFYPGYTYLPYQQETIRNQSNYSIHAYIPLGIDWRVGKKSEFLNHLHLYYEASPTLIYTNIPELNHYLNARITQSLGLRINWM